MNFIALDTGSSSIRLSCNNQLLFDEPNQMAYNSHKKIIALGHQAEPYKGIHIVKAAQNKHDLYIYIDELFERYKLFRFYKRTRLLFSAPSFFNHEDCIDMRNHILRQGSAHVEYEQQIWCGALGAHLNVEGPVYSCMIHIGYSFFELALFSKGQMIQKEIYPYGGQYVDRHIRTWLHKNYQLQISDKQLETLKRSIGQAIYVVQPKTIQIQGIDIHQQLRHIQMDENTFARIFSVVIYQWSRCIYTFLDQMEPIVQQAIALRGMMMCGGTSQIKHLSHALYQQLHIPFTICPNASLTVLEGLEILLDRMENRR